MKTLDLYRSYAVNHDGPLGKEESAYCVGHWMAILDIAPEVRRLIAGDPQDQEDAQQIVKGLWRTVYNAHHEAKKDEERDILHKTMRGICRLQVRVDQMIEGR